MKLGKIQKIELRNVWKHEGYDFSRWLADPNNIQYLNEKIGLNLVDIQVEQNVGSYKCDIVCRDEFSNKIVIIENQLENTDHDHLGKIITYASGLDASVIIWIVKNARDEHASAIEWLNNHTDDSILFFLIQIELISIEDSNPAPQFTIIEAPNDFSKSLKQEMKESNLTESKAFRLQFWQTFNEVMNERNEFSVRKPTTDHWYNFSIGTSICNLMAELLNKENKVRINMWIPDNKAQFDFFYENKTEIESTVGIPLEWDIMADRKGSRIHTYINGFSFSAPGNHKNISNQMIDMLVKFRAAFKPHINRK